MVNDISENIEEYLEVLYRNGNNREQVSTNTFSKELNIAPASVTQMIKKLEKLGYVKYIPYNGASLTDKGIKIAQLITRKHRILEIVLSNILKIKEENVHSQACVLEHAISDEALRSLCLILNCPSISNGSKIIPACNLDFKTCLECSIEKDFDNITYRKKSLLAISEIKELSHGTVAFIRGNEDLLEEALNIGINIGSIIHCNNNGNITFIVNGNIIDIPLELANNIFIEF